MFDIGSEIIIYQQDINEALDTFDLTEDYEYDIAHCPTHIVGTIRDIDTTNEENHYYIISWEYETEFTYEHYVGIQNCWNLPKSFVDFYGHKAPNKRVENPLQRKINRLNEKKPIRHDFKPRVVPIKGLRSAA